MFHIIGDADTIVGFAFAGVSGDAVKTADEALAAFSRIIADKQTQLLIVTNHVAELIESSITAHRLQSQPPYIVEVGDIWGRSQRHKSLEQLIQEAVGISLVKDDQK